MALVRTLSTSIPTNKTHPSSVQVLNHYNPVLPIKLAADTSAYGAGGVILRMLPDDNESPIVYASCTLSPSECNCTARERSLPLTLEV